MSVVKQFLRRAGGSLVTSPAEPGRVLAGRARAHRFAQALTVPATLQPAPEPPSPGRLERYFDANLEGPGIWKWRHYFPIYERHLEKFVGREVHVVEIGIYSGGSLPMWREYFGPGCHVHGVDIEEACRSYEGDHVDVHIGDQADPEFWKRFRAAVPRVDVVIDDGGHLPDQQIATLEGLLAHIQPGGVFLCEDIAYEGNKFDAFVGKLSDGLNNAGPEPAGDRDPAIAQENERTPLQHAVASVHRYPFVTVIEKPEALMPPLHSARRGTEWQPFLTADHQRPTDDAAGPGAAAVDL